jgi:hypothetical protein
MSAPHYGPGCGEPSADPGMCVDCLNDQAACPECHEPIRNGMAATEYRGREYHAECADIAAERDADEYRESIGYEDWSGSRFTTEAAR